MFNTIGLVTKPKDPTSENTTHKLCNFLVECGVSVVTSTPHIKERADLIIVLGGDGTLLDTARRFVDENIPILGVNLGRLGFLADVSVENMLSVVGEVLAGEFVREERALLACQIEKLGHVFSQHLAFNDVVIHRKDLLNLIEFDIFID
jgi:NAD+ kinase